MTEDRQVEPIHRPRSSSMENVCLTHNNATNDNTCRLCIILPDDQISQSRHHHHHHRQQQQTYLSLVVETQTPILDLLVYVSSVCHFNPSDYVLCLSNSSGSILLPLRPSQRVGDAVPNLANEASFLRVVAKQSNLVSWQKMSSIQKQPSDGSRKRLFPMVFVPTVIMPNGRIWQPPAETTSTTINTNVNAAEQRLSHLLTTSSFSTRIRGYATEKPGIQLCQQENLIRIHLNI
ncbi:hypothetical protein ACOME3_002584 [Neoechinorhynchus agilis]